MKAFTGDSRTDAAIIIDATIRGGERSTDLTNAAATKYRDPRDFGLLRELVGGVLRRRAALERVVGPHVARGLDQTRPLLREMLLCHAYQMLFLDRVPPHARVSGAVNAARRIDGENGAKFVNAVARAVERAGAEGPASILDAMPIEVRLSIPPAFDAQIRAACGGTADPVQLEKLATPAPIAVRIPREPSLRQKAVDALILSETLATPGRWAPDCLILDSGRILATDAVPQLILPQDEGSQLVVAALAPEDGQKVLDLCSGTGIKTSQILDIAPGADVLAIDTDTRKLDRCKELCRVAGRGKPRVRGADATSLPDEMDGRFDRILLDAPCTGAGTMRRRPEVRYTRTENDFARAAVLQEALLERAVRLIAPGGRLVYAVCSFAPVEGIDVVRRVLARHTDLALRSTGLDQALAAPDHTVTTLPWVYDMDGFFIAVIGRD